MRRGLLSALVVLGALSVAPAALGYIYWTNPHEEPQPGAQTAVARAGLDGTGIDESLVTGIRDGVGVASDGTYVYWGEQGTGGGGTMGAIGRATVDGGSPDHAFRSSGTFCATWGVRVSTTHVYWVRSNCNATNSIVRDPNAGGTPVETGPQGIGLDVDSTYIYWADGDRYIGRALLNGGSPDPTWLDVGAGAGPRTVAVSPTHVYYTLRPLGGTKIGRATIDGDEASVDNDFIDGASFRTQVPGIAVEGDFLYWANQSPDGVTGSIGRASLDGSGVDHTFIPSIDRPESLDVDSAGSAPAPPGAGPLPDPPSYEGPPLITSTGGGGSSGPPFVGAPSSSNGSFAVGSGSTPSQARRGGKAVPRGTVFSYTVDQDAAITIAIQRKKAGRLVKGNCRKATKRNRKKPKCDLTVATLYRSGVSGQNQVPFTGRIDGKALKPGKYAAVFAGTSAAGTGAPASAPFRIVKP